MTISFGAKAKPVITSKSQCGGFEFAVFLGYGLVHCLTCEGWGRPGAEHACEGKGATLNPELNGGYCKTPQEKLGNHPTKAAITNAWPMVRRQFQFNGGIRALEGGYARSAV